MKSSKITNPSRADELSSRIQHPLRRARSAAVPSSIPLLLAAFLGLLAMGAANRALARDLNPGVEPPGSNPHGKSYAEWSAAWWQWVLSLPATAHPLADTADCSAGQSGPVWFLGGKFCTFPAPPGGCNASVAVRTCTIPKGKALFFPLLNTEDSVLEESLGIGCGPINPTEADLRHCAASVVNGFADLACEIDGRPVHNLETFRVQSPLFQFTMASHDNILAAVGEAGIPDGATSQGVSDGIYLMLEPLREGGHTLHFHSRFTCAFCGDFSLDVTYYLDVAQGYTFAKVATLGVAPNFGDFEVGQINKKGDVIFVSETPVCRDSVFGPQTLCEGVFLGQKNQVSQLVGPGSVVPGGIYDGSILGTTAVNDAGDAALPLWLSPIALPFGLNGGVYRYSQDRRSLRAVVLPGVTPVPGGRGSKFQGIAPRVSINKHADIVFSGIIPSTRGLPGKTLGQGIFMADHDNRVTAVCTPGDPVRGGGTLDFAQNAWINDQSDVVFEAHRTGAECLFNPDFTAGLGCGGTGVYLSKDGHGPIIPIAEQGDADPSGRRLRHAWGPVINNAGRVLFVGDLTTAPATDLTQGLYLYHDKSIVPVARPGDGLPGGGRLKTVNDFVQTYDLNDHGDICFSAILDNGEQGIYVQRHGRPIQLVAKTGTILPGIGTFKSAGGGPSGPVMNEHRDLAFAANLANGQTVLVVATPD